MALAKDSKLTPSRPRVAVVGLGACGLVTLKNLLEAGFDAVGYDRNEYVGGLWKFSEEDKTTVLKTTRANLSKQGGCYTDFPFSDKIESNYPTAEEFGSYFDEYATHFRLFERTRLGKAVEMIKRVDNENAWEVQFTEKQNGNEEAQLQSEKFDRVILCHGLQVQVPNVPKIEGIESFPGTAVHSNQYKGPEPYEGKRVVIVGLGNTGSDTACDLVGHASKIWISHRAGHAIVSATNYCF
jgi:dimethylaniline monooxygenase (N-oxide forming)